ncbi:TonB family protein [Melioribacteraceae bacterium 4301-Me]|uniref:TonB family protein n=1 Tax=Pyranulibacter aquaticus TaxID=3163344 RepID=UPI00359B3803
MQKLFESHRINAFFTGYTPFLFIFCLITGFLDLSFAQNGHSKSYYADGTLRADISYINDIYDGISYWFYPNGNLQAEKSFSLGKLNGWVREYYESGLLKKEYYVSNGIIDGIYKSYYSNGQLNEVAEYKLGKRISYKKFPFDTTYKALPQDYLAGNRQLEILQKKNQTLICDVDICPIPIEGINSIQKKLIYPEHALMYGLQGTVTLIATVDTNGDVVNTEVIKHLGLGCDEAAIEAVKETKFIPGQRKGKIVESHVTINVYFELDKQQNTFVTNNGELINNKPAFLSNKQGEQEKVEQKNTIEKKYYTCEIDECAQPVGGLKSITDKIIVPAIAKRLKLKGNILVEVKVDQNGIVLDTKVLEGIGYGCDEAVESAIFATKFLPGKQNFIAVNSVVRLVIPFNYEN